jgi:hypothetical protein
MASAELSRRPRRSSATRLYARWLQITGASSTRRYSSPDSLEDLPGKLQVAILKAEQNRPQLRVVSGD